jgi:hypothetical protein
MITVNNASTADIREVFANLSAVSRAEMMREEGEPDFQVSHVFCVRDELGPLFVFGFGAWQPGTWRTSFGGTQRYFDMGAAGVRLMQRFVRKLMADHPGDVFISRTRSTHPEVVRWYRLLGGHLIGCENGRSTFRFEPIYDSLPPARNEASRTLANSLT